ncbi:pyridoxamine 5'-phosphate oxidase family protein [Leptothoe sp. PORK10 BA2]|uniref:pyridoxamine 5'-phosphate oxidase family protein n=1 Tax=Leptothoe sp. PORK10 BA2 TaxID=3110254 RepID=UPI002B1F82A5|nr:pyridoxamine 5'-phosphate oxidase family protein [Leptothoe sp. PORK10 BA2]MEA5465976.1 pyridoxamine 5'-phosphate oxidase family protein [Leptothoe sp. PORK10 BA2]
MITAEVSQSIESSVLCWLATIAPDGSPNVSPKEVFMHDGNGRIIVAHIASPQTVRNIESNPLVCLSFIDVFTQKGHKVRGIAKILRESHDRYPEQKANLAQLVGDTFPIPAVIEVEPTAIEEIIAPSYRMFPHTTTSQMVQQALATYKVTEYQNQGQDNPNVD